MSAEKNIFDLIVAAEDQQQRSEQILGQIEYLLKELKKRDEYQKGVIQQFSYTLETARVSARDIQSEFSKSIPQFKTLVLKIMEDEANLSFDRSAKEAAKVLRKEFEPVAAEIQKTLSSVTHIKADLESANKSFIRSATIIFILGVLGLFVLSISVVEWKKYEYQQLSIETTRLQKDIDFNKLYGRPRS